MINCYEKYFGVYLLYIDHVQTDFLPIYHTKTGTSIKNTIVAFNIFYLIGTKKYRIISDQEAF